jgi:predicted DNA-binding transcriptional regulator AlpA
MHLLTAGLIHALPATARRCVDRKEAASYVCVSVGHFDKLVRSGEMPKPIKLGGRKVWDKHTLDQAIDRQSGLVSSLSPVEPSDLSETLSPLDMWRQGSANH